MKGALTLTPEEAQKLHAAIYPASRLRLGDVIYRGYQPSNVADAIHCAHCWLAVETHESTRRLIKSEIERLIKRLEKAALCLT